MSARPPLTPSEQHAVGALALVTLTQNRDYKFAPEITMGVVSFLADINNVLGPKHQEVLFRLAFKRGSDEKCIDDPEFSPRLETAIKSYFGILDGTHAIGTLVPSQDEVNMVGDMIVATVTFVTLATKQN